MDRARMEAILRHRSIKHDLEIVISVDSFEVVLT